MPVCDVYAIKMVSSNKSTLWQNDQASCTEIAMHAHASLASHHDGVTKHMLHALGEPMLQVVAGVRQGRPVCCRGCTEQQL